MNEPSVIYYTLDGTAPTFSSPKWERQGLRRPGELFEFNRTTTVRWMAQDLAGNIGTGQVRFAIETDAPVTRLEARPTAGAARQTVYLTADDNVAGGGAGIARTDYRVNGGAWKRYDGAFALEGAGTYTVEYYSTDLAGNVESPKSSRVEVTAAAPRLVTCRMSLTPAQFRAGAADSRPRVGQSRRREAREDARPPARAGHCEDRADRTRRCRTGVGAGFSRRHAPRDSAGELGDARL